MFLVKLLSLQMSKTVLGLMICSLFVEKLFLHKALPVTVLDANFQYDQAIQTIEIIKHCCGFVVTIVCNNNKANQKFFGIFNFHNPWYSIDNVFLLFDFAHLIKSVS